MRTDRTFLRLHRAAVIAADPAAEDISANTLRTVGLVDLCLHFLVTRMPGESTDAIPVALLGYPEVLDRLDDREGAIRELASLRHLCSRFASYAAWLDALQRHSAAPQTIRCYDRTGGAARRRVTAPAGVLQCLVNALADTVPWVVRDVRAATPGEYHVVTKSGEATLSYTVPALPERLVAAPAQHRVVKRAINPAIVLSMEAMLRVAEQVDLTEAADTWPSSLEPLKLKERLRKIAFHDPQEAVFRDGSLVINGATHVVGMLSSGKSGLVWGVLFALTKGGGGRRVAVLAADTIQAAAMVARLQRHGVSATVLSSSWNREAHLRSIHWQQSLAEGGTMVSSAGDLTTNFSVACPLDGMQTEPKIVRGQRSDTWFPIFKEKPCHKLNPVGGNDEDAGDDELPGRNRRSCPLWSCCPAQTQQRTAVDAQVVVMTPQAFVHMTPDAWVSADLMTVPELLQFAFDVVLIDEVDGLQKTLDGIFAPRETLMGDERTDYAPSIAVRSSEAIRIQSGGQFTHEVNARWQKRFHEFFGLIGTLYAVLQNEGTNLGGIVGEVPFTAGSILYELWRRGLRMRGGDPAAERDQGFLDVTRVAAFLTRMSRTGDPDADDEFIGGPEAPEFREAADTLSRIAARVVLDDYYEGALDQLEGALDGPLAVFDARIRTEAPRPAKRDGLSRRENAAALLLAVVTDLVLQRYVWLIRTQPAVAGDFGIDDTQLLSQANNLVRHYRTLLPANPAGAAFGLSYEAPSGKAERKGGKLTLVNHLGVGRHLVVHLHNLLEAEGQAGPHVLMLSGTSWAGGRILRNFGDRPQSVASPVYDVQVPVGAVLVQPEEEVQAVSRSVFRLVRCLDQNREQVRASGLNEADRRRSLKEMAVKLGAKRGDTNLIEDHWDESQAAWGPYDIADRRRAMLVTNSYADAAFVADAMAEALGREWSVRCLVRDSGDDTDTPGVAGPRLAQPLPRSLVERFGLLPERSILVAPLQVVARGHNILNQAGRAAVSAIYFLHRPHPRPDDMAPVIGRLNRYATERHLHGLRREGDAEDVPARMRRLRYAASAIVRDGMNRQTGYSSLPPHLKAQFAWDLLTPLWQTVGRGIRRGCPVMVGFLDRQFAPHSFKGEQPDTGDSSVLVKIVEELRYAMRDPREGEVARRLYAPFLGALERTRDLRGADA